MTNATGIAMPAAPIDRTDFRSLKSVILAVLASVALAPLGKRMVAADQYSLRDTGMA